MCVCVCVCIGIYIHTHTLIPDSRAADMYDPKDTYGNKDPLPVNRAMQQVGTMLKSLECLPPVERDFFARRIVQHIKEKAFLNEDKPDEPIRAGP